MKELESFRTLACCLCIKTSVTCVENISELAIPQYMDTVLFSVRKSGAAQVHHLQETFCIEPQTNLLFFYTLVP